MKTNKSIGSIQEALEYVFATLPSHPERHGIEAITAALAGRRRKYPVIAINYLISPDDKDQSVDDYELPTVAMPATPAADLAREIINLLQPLKLLNPINPCLGLGKGPGTLVTSFGIPLNPEAGNSPAYTITLEDAMSRPEPDPYVSGLMAEMCARIEFVKQNITRGIYIGLPDMQGPFNLAHAILGEDALVGPYTQPDLFQAFMARVTKFWIAARKTLVNRIGLERLPPQTRQATQISECSVNLISADMYKTFILPFDLQIAHAFGPLAIHPCSGPHVFHVTLQELPQVMVTEAGFIEKTATGSISVDEALAAIGGRPIVLGIGQELPPGQEFEFIRRDLDRYETNPRLTFAYTGMHWRIKDRPRIRALHRRLDDYWRRKYDAPDNDK